MQRGLRGNRVVAPSVWAIIQAMCRSFPLLLAASVSEAKAAAAAELVAGAAADAGAIADIPGAAAVPAAPAGTSDEAAAHAWARAQLHTGLAGQFLAKLPTQPQITGAYDRDAPARSRDVLRQAAELLDTLKVRRVHVWV
uniref:RUN domain-containing protein n=1 Tax=Chlamydomonas euryale TaxID=1486919 RepID=A0A7R9VKM0_9CHLO|mmetsp:Transcript_36703/g.108244  ORF Transcript_36703/g.108244 Transcript_36703/m.108244 type:complete len:140 (+) Transcript_36703:1731-2150(+)|eukprot:349706-Chlamydomonas_euryale.AAC.2